jgi:hypothetical protein
MAILTMLYRSTKLNRYEDNYGGNAFDNYYYSYLFIQDNIIYLFSSNPMCSSSKLKPIQSFDDRKTIENMDVILENTSRSVYEENKEGSLTFSLPAQAINEQGDIIVVTRTYFAVFENDKMSLKLKASDENDLNRSVIETEFERVTIKGIPTL